MSLSSRVNRCRGAAGFAGIAGLGLAILAQPAPAAAGIAVSQMVVDMKPGGSRATDIEIYNDSAERSYVAIEPREIIDPGTAAERGAVSPDPEKLGLLVSPNRLILEPHQRRRLRLAVIGPPAGRERVYRVTVKPVAGEVSGPDSGLKLMVGYDLLVLVRPDHGRPAVTANRSGASLAIANAGNSSVELTEGKQCDGDGKACRPLPGKRLYAGASWAQPLEGGGPAHGPLGRPSGEAAGTASASRTIARSRCAPSCAGAPASSSSLRASVMRARALVIRSMEPGSGDWPGMRFPIVVAALIRCHRRYSRGHIQHLGQDGPIFDLRITGFTLIFTGARQGAEA
jgi:P pilus assembly chaperone PapD